MAPNALVPEAPTLRDVSAGPPVRGMQVLLFHFKAERRPRGGIALDLTIDEDAPCLVSAAARLAALARFSSDEARRTVDALAALRRGEGPPAIAIRLEACGLRHSSAGALPLFRRGGRDAVLLFWRDIAPLGWNIANGGSGQVTELAAVDSLILREAGEELLFIDGQGRVGSVIESPSAEARRAMELWRRRLGAPEGPAAPATLSWGIGPDSLAVHWRGRRTVTDGLFIGVHAGDFGIECSRLLRIDFPAGARPLDGELSGDAPLDRVIGLFDMDDLRRGTIKPRSTWRQGREVALAPGEALCPVTRDLLQRLNQSPSGR